MLTFYPEVILESEAGSGQGARNGTAGRGVTPGTVPPVVQDGLTEGQRSWGVHPQQLLTDHWLTLPLGTLVLWQFCPALRGPSEQQT